MGDHFPSPSSLVVYVNGKYVPEAEALISVYDHGVLYGDGVFDTICAWNGFLFRLDEHIERLFRSMHAVRLGAPVTKSELREIVLEAVRRNGLKSAYVKIVATRGVSVEPLLDPRGCKSGLIVFVRPFLWLIKPERLDSGIRTKIVSVRRIPPACLDPKVKSLNYQNQAMAKIEAIEAGVDEAIMLDVNGSVSEGPTYNLCLISNGVLYTPAENILLGITRETIFELCRREGLNAIERSVTSYDLYNANELFFCSTAGGIMPIVEVDGRQIGDGRPGAVTKRLTKLYFDMLERGEHGTRIYE